MTIADARTMTLAAIGGHQFAAGAPAFSKLLHSTVRRVAGLCEPENLISPSKPQNGFLRCERGDIYILNPKEAVNEDDEIDLPFDLQFAVVNFICAYLSTENKNWYLSEASNIVQLYIKTSSTSVAVLADKDKRHR